MVIFKDCRTKFIIVRSIPLKVNQTLGFAHEVFWVFGRLEVSESFACRLLFVVGNIGEDLVNTGGAIGWLELVDFDPVFDSTSLSKHR